MRNLSPIVKGFSSLLILIPWVTLLPTIIKDPDMRIWNVKLCNSGYVAGSRRRKAKQDIHNKCGTVLDNRAVPKLRKSLVAYIIWNKLEFSGMNLYFWCCFHCTKRPWIFNDFLPLSHNLLLRLTFFYSFAARLFSLLPVLFHNTFSHEYSSVLRECSSFILLLLFDPLLYNISSLNIMPTYFLFLFLLFLSFTSVVPLLKCLAISHLIFFNTWIFFTFIHIPSLLMPSHICYLCTCLSLLLIPYCWHTFNITMCMSHDNETHPFSKHLQIKTFKASKMFFQCRPFWSFCINFVCMQYTKAASPLFIENSFVLNLMF